MFQIAFRFEAALISLSGLLIVRHALQQSRIGFDVADSGREGVRAAGAEEYLAAPMMRADQPSQVGSCAAARDPLAERAEDPAGVVGVDWEAPLLVPRERIWTAVLPR